MIEDSFGKLVQYSPPLCLYVELAAFSIEKKRLSKEVQQQIESILVESKKIKHAHDLIEKNIEITPINSTEEFIAVFHFAPELMSLLNFVLSEQINPPQSVTKYSNSKFELQIQSEAST